jgi:hypothetical protein
VAPGFGAGFGLQELLAFRGKLAPLYGQIHELGAHRFGSGLRRHIQAIAGVPQILDDALHGQPPLTVHNYTA